MAKPRILVADDHAETREGIATLLESEFDVIATVADGQAAVEATRFLHPDVVVLDIAMPVLNGLEAAAIIRDLPDAPGIVFSTAHGDPEFVEAALALGAWLVLKRNLSELASVIRRSLKVHAVYFYEDAELLSRTVADFIGAGLVANQSAVLIATPSHSAAILEQLTAMAVDPLKRIGQGDLVILDAGEILRRIMVDEMPDSRRLEDTVGPILDTAAGTAKRMVRAYGEMVDLLWNDDNGAAAVSLEVLWNQLITRRKFSLLCGYRSAGVGTDARFKKICDQHSHVLSADGPLRQC
jgi:CheY-like chemotaxis protein